MNYYKYRSIDLRPRRHKATDYSARALLWEVPFGALCVALTGAAWALVLSTWF